MPVGLCDTQKSVATYYGEGDLGGIVKIRDRVQKLYGPSRLFQVFKLFFEELRDNPFGVHFDVDNIGLVLAKYSQRTDVRGALGDDDVAGINENPSDKINGLLGTGGDNHIVRMGLNALQPHDV